MLLAAHCGSRPAPRRALRGGAQRAQVVRLALEAAAAARESAAPRRSRARLVWIRVQGDAGGEHPVLRGGPWRRPYERRVAATAPRRRMRHAGIVCAGVGRLRSAPPDGRGRWRVLAASAGIGAGSRGSDEAAAVTFSEDMMQRGPAPRAMLVSRLAFVPHGRGSGRCGLGTPGGKALRALASQRTGGKVIGDSGTSAPLQTSAAGEQRGFIPGMSLVHRVFGLDLEAGEAHESRAAGHDVPGTALLRRLRGLPAVNQHLHAHAAGGRGLPERPLEHGSEYHADSRVV